MPTSIAIGILRSCTHTHAQTHTHTLHTVRNAKHAPLNPLCDRPFGICKDVAITSTERDIYSAREGEGESGREGARGGARERARERESGREGDRERH